jgi:hypothetical protein
LDSEEHAVVGAIIGGGGYLAYKLLKQEPLDPIEAIMSLVGGAIAGLAPDLIEPPTGPNHRSFFHSPAILALIADGNRRALNSERLNESQKLMLCLFSAAYASHLVTDGTTPKGLPVLF